MRLGIDSFTHASRSAASFKGEVHQAYVDSDAPGLDQHISRWERLAEANAFRASWLRRIQLVVATLGDEGGLR